MIMAIKKIIFDDNSEEEFIPTFPEDFEEWNSLRKSWHLHHQRSKWEQNKIFHHLATDLEDYAKDEYDLVIIDEDNSDIKILDFIDYCEKKALKKIIITSKSDEKEEDYLEKNLAKNELLQKILNYIGR